MFYNFFTINYIKIFAFIILLCYSIYRGDIMINLAEKLKIAMIKQHTTQTRLAERSGQSQGNLASKIIRNDFKLSEYNKLVEALGCTLEINIVLPNGEKI